MKDLIRLITKNSDDYAEKNMKIKVNSDNKLRLNKTMEISTMIIVIRAFFLENNKYYPQVFLDKCLYKLANADVEAQSYDEVKSYEEEIKSFCILLAILSITIALLIAVSITCYLIKHKAKQKHLLPYYVRNN